MSRSDLEQAVYNVVYQAVRDAMRDAATAQEIGSRRSPKKESGLRRLSVAQAADVAQLSETTIRMALATGELAGHQRVKGGRWLIKPEALTAWMDGKAP